MDELGFFIKAAEHPLDYYKTVLYDILKKVGPESIDSLAWGGDEMCRYMGELLMQENNEEELRNGLIGKENLKNNSNNYLLFY